MIGQTISRYRIVDKLGEGGMGVVYKAEDTRLGRIVALKFLHEHALRNEDSRKRFEREAKAAALLNHPNICTIYEIDEIEDRLFIAMAWQPGESLAARVERGPLPVREALAIALQCASGLQEAHANSIVHRDLKPSNIFLTTRADADLHVVVMDFGVARLARRSSLTREGATLGTVGYMSPEQTFGGKVDQRTDIWALGVVLYEMLVGRPPFEGEYEQAVAYALVNEEHDPVTALRTGLPVELDRVLSKALAKAQEDRYQSLADFMVDLRAIARSLEATAGRPVTAPRPSVRRIAEPKPRLTLWLPLAALAGAALALLFFRRAPDEPRIDYQLTQITRDAGLSMTPALSPDGNLVAYASDRGSPGALNLWIQQVAGGGAVQLTTDPAADHSPDFSPDGGRIAFRSEREGGGVYVIPALGGEPRLAAAAGRRPRFSPDGTRLAYYTAPPSSIRGSRSYIASAEGRQPRQIAAGFDAAAMPIWTHSGARIAYWGSRTGESEDVWIVSSTEDGAEPVKTGLREALLAQNLSLASLNNWDPATSSLVFSGSREDSINLWTVPLSVEGTPSGPARRLTLGRDERDASATVGGKVAFMAGDRRINIWSMPLNGGGDAPAGEPRQITESAASDYTSAISADGQTLIFRSTRLGFVDIWSARPPDGQPISLTSNEAFESIPRLSTDSRQVAFSVNEQGDRIMYTVDTDGKGATTRVCDQCGAPIAWTPAGGIIYQALNPIATFALFQEGERRMLFTATPHPIYAGHLSQDGRWFVFKGDLDDHRTRVFATPFAPDILPIDSGSWIEITEGESWDDIPRFSPDNRIIYYSSDRDGFRCIWARRFDPEAQRPVGEAFPMRHFHGMDLSLSGLSLNEFELSVGPDQLVFPLLKQSGNVWMLSPTR
jgi:Tol biopolymer transport system component